MASENTSPSPNSTDGDPSPFFLPAITFDSLEETFDSECQRFADSEIHIHGASLIGSDVSEDKSTVKTQCTQTPAVFRVHRSSQCSNTSSTAGSEEGEEEFPMRKYGREDMIQVIEIPLKAPLRKRVSSFAKRRSLREPVQVPIEK